MKRVIAIAKFEAYIPDDMTVSQIQNEVKNEIEFELHSFSTCVKGYHDESNQCPTFELLDVMVGTEAMVAVGGE